jgi:hypothetical protein
MSKDGLKGSSGVRPAFHLYLCSPESGAEAVLVNKRDEALRH